MSINVQLMKTLIQLQAMQSMNNTSSTDSMMGSDNTDSFSSMLTALLGANMNGTDQLTLPANLPMAGGLGQLGAQGLPTSIPPVTSNDSLFDSKDYDSYINDAAAKYHVDPKLIRSVIQHESSFNPMSVSSAGAIGLMQLMPGTAQGLGVTDPFDPKQNIEGGTKYLKQLLDTFDNNKALAVAAYNAGPGNVKKYNGIPPFQETQNYVRKVLQTYMS
jgi:soluble lytic murein transglycosylase-like protein